MRGGVANSSRHVGLCLEFVLALHFQRSFCTIHRSEGTRTGSFENPDQGHALIGHTVATHFVASRIDCAFECVGHPRCLSYNYEEGNASRNQCELNDQTRVTRPRDYQSRPGTTYYGAKEEKVSPFVVEFPWHFQENYIRTTIPKPLREFSLCFWMKTRRGDQRIFTYATKNDARALVLLVNSGMLKLYINSQRAIKGRHTVPFSRDRWHHLCFTLEISANRTLKTYMDGVLQLPTGSLPPGEVIKANGDFIIGQRVEELGGSFVSSKRFSGFLHSFNMWDSAFDGNVVTRMFAECVTEYWAVVAWADMRQLIGGNLSVGEESPCSSGHPTPDFQLEFSTASSANFAKYDSIPWLKRFSICAWFKLLSAEGTFFSYVMNSPHFNPMVAALTSSRTLVLNVSGEVWQDWAIPYPLDHWHHFCFLWSKDNGVLSIAFDGQRRVASKKPRNKDQDIPANGVFILGQEQDRTGTITGVRPYHGVLSHLNIWFYKLTVAAVDLLYAGCQSIEGNALGWSVFRADLQGQVIVKEGSECALPTFTVQNQRDQTCNDTFASTDTCLAPLTAAFDRASGTLGKSWQCYYSNALRLTAGQTTPRYDHVLLSNCTRNITAELLTIGS